MRQQPLVTADDLTADWLGSAARPLPERLQPSTPSDLEATEPSGSEPAPTRGVWRSALRWLRDTIIGLSVIISLPLAVIATDRNGPVRDLSRVSARIQQVEPLRVLRLPSVSALSPLAAGERLHAIGLFAESDRFPLQPVMQPTDRAWQHVTLDNDVFPDARRRTPHLVQSSDVLRAATQSLSEAEHAYLRLVAEAPIWNEIDQLATVDVVDVLGARYVLPLPDDASPLLMPIPRFSATAEIAYASLSRAAYHLAQGDPDRAEHALRAALSYGFLLIDNGGGGIEGLVGSIVVGVARDGLHTLYTLTGNHSGVALTAPTDDAGAAASGRPATRPEQQLLALARDPSTSRTVRLESLEALAFSSCTSVRGVLFGPSAEVNAAFDEARRTLARFPSERAYLDMLQDAPNRPRDFIQVTSREDGILLGAASVAATVLHNPRIQMCTMLMSGNW